nr:NAD-dependent epimerase/dehydratase family protein [Pigmentibacter ruber]
MTKVLVTGANGFLGKKVCKLLISKGYEVIGTYRSSHPQNDEFKLIHWIKIQDLQPKEVWIEALKNCDIVIHTAGRVHQMNSNKNSDNLFFNDNTNGTDALICEILQNNSSIKQFIFISTLLVYGRYQTMPLNKNKECNPDTIYGKSKLAAENIIQKRFKNSSISWTILRPAVMYNESDSENTGNIASIVNYIKKGIPLPIKNLKNKRSFLSVNRMAEFIHFSILNENAKNKIFNVSDPEPISTEQFVLFFGKLINKKPKLVWVPFFMQYILAILGDIIQLFRIRVPWNTAVLTKISSNFWTESDSFQKISKGE